MLVAASAERSPNHDRREKLHGLARNLASPWEKLHSLY